MIQAELLTVAHNEANYSVIIHRIWYQRGN